MGRELQTERTTELQKERGTKRADMKKVRERRNGSAVGLSGRDALIKPVQPFN